MEQPQPAGPRSTKWRPTKPGDWQTNVPVTQSSFAFAPPPGARKVASTELKQPSEVPEGAVMATRN